MSAEPSRSFSDIGLPEGHAFPQLAYHYPTGTIIAHTRPLKSLLPSHRLSMRSVSKARYTPIGDFTPAVSISSFALNPTLPELYFVTESWREIGDTVGGDWDALHRFTLDTRQSEIVARPGDLAVQAPYRTGWLAELLSVAPDGGTLFCRAGFQTERGTVEYYLSEYSVPYRRLIVISRLERAFA